MWFSTSDFNEINSAFKFNFVQTFHEKRMYAIKKFSLYLKYYLREIPNQMDSLKTLIAISPKSLCFSMTDQTKQERQTQCYFEPLIYLKSPN